jgi:HlyD family secretion protein
VKQTKRIAFLVAAIAVIGAGVFGLRAAGVLSLGVVESREAAAAEAGDQLAGVEAKAGSISVTVEAPAVVEPFRQLDLRSRVAGSVVEAASEGESASAGDVLVRFDDSEHRTALRQAQLNLEQARVDLQRARLAVDRVTVDLEDKESLFASGSITRNERDAAEQTLSGAQLDLSAAEIKVNQSNLVLETATADLAATELRAPFGGVVLEDKVGPGDVVSSGTVLLTFADVSRLRLRAEVDEFDIGRVEEGMPVMISADSLGDDSVRSTVERVSPAAEIVNNISVFTITTVIRRDAAALRPGMSADLTVLVSEDSGLVVPSSAVTSVRGRAYLDVYENEEIVTKRVTAGTDDGRSIVILDGLEEGELVVVPQAPGFTLGSSGGATTSGTSIVPIPMPGAGGSR